MRDGRRNSSNGKARWQSSSGVNEPDLKHLAEPQTASTSAASLALSKDLKKQGWQFVGPTTVYAFMQAMGLINDHVADCVIRSKVEQARMRFGRPGH
jgi:DNA-3-methyladenine glycosylase I